MPFDLFYLPKYHFRRSYRLLPVFLTSLLLLMFACAAAVCFDYDLSYDHDDQYPVDIIFQPIIFISNACLKISVVKFIGQSIILPFLNRYI